MSGRADTNVLSVNIFPILSAWPRRSLAIQLAVVVITGLPFLDQLTAITQKYVGSSRESKRLFISLQAKSTFLLSGSNIDGLNCSIRQCGLASSLGVDYTVGWEGFEVVFHIGLITAGLADLVHHNAGVALVRGAICGLGGCGAYSSLSCIGASIFLLHEKLTTASERFLMVVWAESNSIWALVSSSLSDLYMWESLVLTMDL